MVYELIELFFQKLSAKINKSIEQQVVNGASSGKLTIMKSIATDPNAPSDPFLLEEALIKHIKFSATSSSL